MAAARASTSSELFPEGYDESNRKKMDMHVEKILRQMYTKYGSGYPEIPPTVVSSNFKWLKQDSTDKLFAWVKDTEPEVQVAPKQQTISKSGTKSKGMRTLEEDLERLTLGAKKQHSDSATGTKQKDETSLELGAKYFCEHFYHVRELLQWQLNAAESTSIGEKPKFSSDPTCAIECEHCPGAEEKCMIDKVDKAKRKEYSAPKDKNQQEIFCVGAVAVLTFTNGKQLIHSAHNENPKCSYSDHSKPKGQKSHAEVTVLEDLVPLLLKVKNELRKSKARGVIKVCLFLSYQPCHNSTDYGSSYAPPGQKNVSCYEYIKKYLSSFNKADERCFLEITLKLAYFHKFHFAKSTTTLSQKSTVDPTETHNELIDNAMYGMKELIKTPNLAMSHMTEDDWTTLWKIL